MTAAFDRMTDEFRRLDDELSAAVTLPPVDAVIRRAGALNRASTAAAAAVLTVGGLGGITAVAQATAAPVHSSAAQAVLPAFAVLHNPRTLHRLPPSKLTGHNPSAHPAVWGGVA